MKNKYINLLILVLFTTIIIGITTAEAAPSVSIIPASQNVKTNDTFMIGIYLDPAGGSVSAGEIGLSFDAKAFQATGITKGDILGSDALTTGSKYNNTAGTVTAVLARVGETPDPSLAGYWANVTFKAIGIDTNKRTFINLTSIGLADKDFNDIIGAVSNNGTVILNPAYPTVNITPASQTVSAGKNLTIRISVNPDNLSVSGGEINLKFNASVLQVQSLTKGDILGSDAFDTGSSYDNTAGTVAAVLARMGTSTGPTSPGTWATVNFTVNKTAKAGTYPVNITSAGMVDETFNDIVNIKVNNGSIKVVTLVGDINGDCKVDFKDLGILGAAYGKSKGDTGYREDADLNGDGTINFKDLGILGSNYGKTC